MLTVSQLLASKKSWNEGDHGHSRIERIQSIPQASTVLEAARMMNEHRIGSLVVTDTFNELCGIITERDILTRVIAEERPPSQTQVSIVMTKKVLSCAPSSTLAEVRQTLTDERIRHLPVIEDGSIVGMISIGDLNAATNADMHIEVKAMREYITSG